MALAGPRTMAHAEGQTQLMPVYRVSRKSIAGQEAEMSVTASGSRLARAGKTLGNRLLVRERKEAISHREDGKGSST